MSDVSDQPGQEPKKDETPEEQQARLDRLVEKLVELRRQKRARVMAIVPQPWKDPPPKPTGGG